MHRTQEGRKKHWEKNCLTEGQAYLSLPVKLGGCILPALIFAPDVVDRAVLTANESQGEGQPPQGAL